MLKLAAGDVGALRGGATCDLTAVVTRLSRGKASHSLGRDVAAGFVQMLETEFHALRDTCSAAADVRGKSSKSPGMAYTWLDVRCLVEEPTFSVM
jgi:hypothetical protein